jgi:hypothetical protein
MHANGRIDSFEFMGQRDGALARGQVRADLDEKLIPGLKSTLNRFFPVTTELPTQEMNVSVYQFRTRTVEG